MSKKRLGVLEPTILPRIRASEAIGGFPGTPLPPCFALDRRRARSIELNVSQMVPTETGDPICERPHAFAGRGFQPVDR
jgi:hypothetical protein